MSWPAPDPRLQILQTPPGHMACDFHLRLSQDLVSLYQAAVEEGWLKASLDGLEQP